MIIQHNINAMNANRNLGSNGVMLGKSTEKLSSGFAINRAGDDAAGLSISEKMRSQIRGLDRATKNAQDGISLIQTAEGALNETHDILQRMRELSVQAATGTNQDTDRGYLQDEIDALIEEIDRISDTTQFNKMNILDKSTNGGKFTFHVGAMKDQKVSVTIEDMDSTYLTVSGLDVSDDTGVKGNAAIDTVDTAIEKVSAQRSALGAVQNRLEHTINNLSVTSENVQASESRIRDTDMATEMLKYTRSNILAQASQSMLAQANSRPQQVLQLLQ